MEENVYLGRYRIYRDDNGSPVEAAFGTGTTTYKAEDTTNGREVIVQLVPVIGRPRRVRDELDAEARAAKQITHLNVPALQDFGLAGEEFVYVTEYFDGTSAEAWVKERGPLPIGAVLRIATQMVGALGAATFHGIVHHTLHPGNVMLVPGQTAEGDWPLIKVANFLELAPSFTTAETSGSGLHDPANYASPEQLQNGAVDFRSEVYSLGCILWFLLTGVPPFAGAVAVENAPGVPVAVTGLIAQMLSLDPSERQLDPLALQEQIENCIAQVDRRDALASNVGLAPASMAVASHVIPSSARRPFSWKPLALAALLLIAVALAALVLPRSFRRGQLSTRESRPIGVPIGIPETPPVASTPGASFASSTASSADKQKNTAATRNPESARVTDHMHEVARMNSELDRMNNVIREVDRVLTSPASADDSKKVAENSAPAAVSAPAAESKAQEAASRVAENVAVTAPVSEPPSPSEGPAESSAPIAQEPTSLAQTADKVSNRSSTAMAPEPASPSRTVARESEEPAIKSTPAKSSSVAKAKQRPKRATRATRYASSPTADAMPPLPRHAVRAQYLGTTPDGELVFGLPSSERVYAAPAAGRRGPSRRRGRRVIREPIEDLQVLPALPPDE